MEFPLLVLVLGPVLLAEALLARYEVMAYTAGWRTPTTELPHGMPYARGADPDRPPDAFLVYLDGIGKRRFTDTRDGGQLVKALIAEAPELRVLGQVQPYSPLADPLVNRPHQPTPLPGQGPQDRGRHLIPPLLGAVRDLGPAGRAPVRGHLRVGIAPVRRPVDLPVHAAAVAAQAGRVLHAGRQSRRRR
ncbi:hypothetical protein ACFLIM_49215 [Nonomuraea sp. M3C6]|uniref:Uncharacterized protein n=2 Tax=Nonomuraea marmarensis TaxID=3351344 RepID=A0ABW7AXS2_9ACTN